MRTGLSDRPALPTQRGEAPTDTIAFVNASVIPMGPDGVLENHTVIVTGDRITAVGPAAEVEIPAEAETIDAEGKYLMPGLWDMHTHSVRDPTADPWAASVTNMDWHFPLFIAYGVTGVRNMNDASADTTLELANSVKRRLAAGELIGPRLLVSR